MEFLLVFALFLVCFGFFLVWGRAHPRRIAARRCALAVRHGLSLVTHGRNWPGASPRAGGESPGRHIKFRSYTTGSGKARRHLDATAVAGGAHVPALAARSRPRLAELCGAREITVGDAPFCATWFVRSNRPHHLGALLLPEIRTRLLALHSAGGKGSVESGEGWIRHAEEGHFGQEKVLSRLEQILPALEDLPFAVEVSAGD